MTLIAFSKALVLLPISGSRSSSPSPSATLLALPTHSPSTAALLSRTAS